MYGCFFVVVVVVADPILASVAGYHIVAFSREKIVKESNPESLLTPKKLRAFSLRNLILAFSRFGILNFGLFDYHCIIS